MVYSNILDPIQPTLDPTVFDNTDDIAPKLKPQHKFWIVNSVTQVLEKHGYSHSNEWLDLVLTGSLTTFQYSPESDVDISLFVNAQVLPEWSRAEMIALMVEHVDGTTLPGTTHPMQCFVVPPGIKQADLYKPGLRSGYDIFSDRWIVPPEHGRVHDVEQEYNSDYVFALECADKMERLLRYEPDKAITYWHQIHKRRQRDQKAGKGDYSQANIVYKFLNNRGLFPKISDISGEYIAKTASDYQAMLDANAGQNLNGLPGPVNVPGYGKLQFHSNGDIQRVANEYNQTYGLGQHPTDYMRVNPENAARIAQEYERMPHAPNDPNVKAAYDALAHEVRQQYDHAVNNGYQFEFYPQGHDPYPNSPREAVMDLHQNKHMYVYPTDTGYGQDQQTMDHPLLGDSGVRWNGQPVTHNDLFRAIHDFYGHAKEGLGFRADGEDNAYRQHAAMFSPLARKALTSETRGQNSWVNFGPHAEHNRGAGQGDTIYAEQKAGLLPDWTEDPYLHRTAKTARENFMIDPSAIDQARQHLNLNAPVQVNLVGGTSGQYQGMENGQHVINLVSWLRPDSASKQLWHELTHAAQAERDPDNFWAGMNDYWNTRSQGHEAYRNHPWEVEAQQIADSHPFPLVAPTQPGTNDGSYEVSKNYASSQEGDEDGRLRGNGGQADSSQHAQWGVWNLRSSGEILEDDDRSHHPVESGWAPLL